MITTDDILNLMIAHASNIKSYFSLSFNGLNYRIAEKDTSSLNSVVKCKIYFEKEFKTFLSKPSFYASLGSGYY
uniref:Uncharacterized protein n=1 Tax=Panagrolaimus sp. PS1159 TaxID=55785 RepID=A0AC35EYR6_9BILA